MIIVEYLKKCPDCNGKIKYTPDEVYCTKCGLVIDDSPLEQDSETPDYIGDDTKSNNYAPMSYISGHEKKRTPPTRIG